MGRTRHGASRMGSLGGFNPRKPASPHGDLTAFCFKAFKCVKTGNEVGEKQSPCSPPHPTPGPHSWAAGSSCGLCPTCPNTDLGGTAPPDTARAPSNPCTPAASPLKCVDPWVHVSTHSYVSTHAGTHECTGLGSAPLAGSPAAGECWEPGPGRLESGGGSLKPESTLKLLASCSALHQAEKRRGFLPGARE